MTEEEVAAVEHYVSLVVKTVKANQTLIETLPVVTTADKRAYLYSLLESEMNEKDHQKLTAFLSEKLDAI